MSRYYSTSLSAPLDWAMDLPYQEMLQGISAKTQQQEANLGTLDKLSAMGQSIYYREEDRQRAMGILSEIDEGVNTLAQEDLTDPTNLFKVREFARNTARRFSGAGDAGAIMKAKDTRDAIYNRILEDDSLQPFQKGAYMKAWDAAYEGIGDDLAPVGGKYATYEAGSTAPFQDIYNRVFERLSKVEKDINEDKWTELVGPYFEDKTEYLAMTKSDRALNVAMAEFYSPEIQSYIQDAKKYGYDPYINSSSTSFEDLFLQTPQLDDKGKPVLDDKGNPVMERQFNPDNYYAKVFSSAYSQFGTERKKGSKLRNNKWYEKMYDEEQIAEDNELSDLYTRLAIDLYTSPTGTVDLSAQETAQFIGDGKISPRDLTIFGAIPALNKMEGESQEMAQDLLPLLELYAATYDGKWKLRRMISHTDFLPGYTIGLYNKGRTNKGRTMTKSEYSNYSDMLNAYANAYSEKYGSEKEAKKAIEKIIQEFRGAVGGTEEMGAAATLGIKIRGGAPVSADMVNEGSLRTVNNQPYLIVQTEGFEGAFSNKEIEHINKLLGDPETGEVPIYQTEDGNISVRGGLKYNFNIQHQVDYNKDKGIKYSPAHSTNLLYTMNNLVQQTALKSKFEEESNLDASQQTVVQINDKGAIYYVLKPKK